VRKFKYWFLGSGIVIAVVGVLSLPMGSVANPKRATSLFNNIADVGGFLTPLTGILIVGGIVLFLISCFIKDEWE
jgi:hypothetical protein